MREKPLILLVDDEESFIEIMSAKLGASGFDTASAHNEAEALLEVERLMPDMVLMDIHMPGPTGTDAALAIKQNPKTRDMKIAFFSSLKDPWPALQGDKQRISSELGMQDFIEKTEDLDVVVDKIKNILARKEEAMREEVPPSA